MLYADSMVRLPNHPVMITDRICMAHGLEARSPFMDHELAEFAARLPAALEGARRHAALHPAQARRALSAAADPQSAEAGILLRPALPAADASTRSSVSTLPARLASRRRIGILDGAVDRRDWSTSTLARRADHGNRLWLLINAELWYRMAILRPVEATTCASELRRGQRAERRRTG